MRVSVALCTHNGERFLGEQLRSIAAQSRPPDEVVVGDDRSADATAEMVAAWAAEVPFPVSFLAADEPLGTARNFGRTIAATSGDVIVLADQDDVWHPTKLDRLADALRDSAGLAFSDGGLIDADGLVVAGSCFANAGLATGDLAAIARGDAFRLFVDHQLSLRSTVMGATLAFRREHLDRVLPLPDWLPATGKGALLHDS